MKTFTTIFIILTSINFGTLRAEDLISKRRIGIIIHGGIFPECASIEHDYGFQRGRLKASFSFGFGVCFGPFDFINSANILFSIEAKKVNLNSSEVSNQFGDTAEWSGSGIPILIWSQIQQPGKFGAIFRFGMGAIKVNLTEQFSFYSYRDNEFNWWSFALGLGGGLRYSVSPRFEMLLLGEVVIGTNSSNIVENELGWERWIASNFGILYLGLSFKYSF